jgi:hypothetical protein
MGMSEQVVSRVLFPEAVTRFRDNGHSSSLDVAIEIERPTREPGRATPYVPLFGLAPGGVYQALPVTRETGELLPHPFTLTPADITKVGEGGLLSVALSFPSPGLGVTQHLALWSPDFPLPCYNGRAAAICPTPTYPLKDYFLSVIYDVTIIAQ